MSGFCLFWGYVWMYSGRHVVNTDFQLLDLESDRKKGGFWGLFHLHILYVSIPYTPLFEIDVIMTGCRPAMFFYIATRISVKYHTKKA